MNLKWILSCISTTHYQNNSILMKLWFADKNWDITLKWVVNFPKIEIYPSPSLKELERNHSQSEKKQFFLGLNPSRSLLLSRYTWSRLWGGIPPTLLRYLNIHIWYEIETYARHTSWPKITIDDVIILFTWIGYNLQTRSKMRNRYPILGSIATILISNFVR